MKFYVTFRISSVLRDKYTVLDVNSYDRARDVAMHVWPNDYSMIYSEQQWTNYRGETVAQKSNLRPLQ